MWYGLGPQHKTSFHSKFFSTGLQWLLTRKTESRAEDQRTPSWHRCAAGNWMLLNDAKWKSHSRVWLFAIPWTVALEVVCSSTLQTRVLECVAISFSREPSRPRDWTWVSCIVGRFFTNWATTKSLTVFQMLPSFQQSKTLSLWGRGSRPSCLDSFQQRSIVSAGGIEATPFCLDWWVCSEHSHSKTQARPHCRWGMSRSRNPPPFQEGPETSSGSGAYSNTNLRFGNTIDQPKTPGSIWCHKEEGQGCWECSCLRPRFVDPA